MKYSDSDALTVQAEELSIMRLQQVKNYGGFYAGKHHVKNAQDALKHITENGALHDYIIKIELLTAELMCERVYKAKNSEE